MAALGSSPLARGLRLQHRRRRGRGGIIPARAGFTWPLSWSMVSRWDHPRSRGVYPPPSWWGPRRAGSSPLARGLRWRRRRPRGRDGIIPARAGFTSAANGQVIGVPDHPRSRGVYSLWDMLEKLKDGSSPLARGLHLTVSRRQPAARIIPARAGFTPPRSHW